MSIVSLGVLACTVPCQLYLDGDTGRLSLDGDTGCRHPGSGVESRNEFLAPPEDCWWRHLAGSDSDDSRAQLKRRPNVDDDDVLCELRGEVTRRCERSRGMTDSFGDWLRCSVR